MEYTLSLVSCRSTVTGLPLNYWVSAPLLSSPLPLFLPPLSLLLAAVCLCVLCMKRAEKKNREESGGRVASTYNRLPGDSIKHNEFPEASIPWFIVWIHLFTYIQDLLAIKCLNETVCFIDSPMNAEHPFRYRGYIQQSAIIPLNELHISNDPKLHVLCIHLS